MPLLLNSPIFSIPLRAIFASKGEQTPPCGTPWGNYGLIPALRHLRNPLMTDSGAITCSSIVWLDSCLSLKAPDEYGNVA